MKINFKQLEYFRALMTTGTVSRAAELMNVSQPNLSRIIKHMETRLGMPLFERRSGRLLPTPEAAALFREIEPLHVHLTSLDETVQRIIAGEAGRFCLGTSPSLGRFVVPHLLAKLHAKYPNAELRVDVLSVAQVIDYLSYAQGECACTIFPIDHPIIESTPLTEGRLVCAMPKKHPLATRKTLSARDLAGEHLIGFDAATPHGQIVTEFFEQARLAPRFPITVRFAETACALVEQGLGLTLIDEFTCTGNTFPQLTAVPVQTRSPFRIHLHQRRDRASSALGNEFRELLRRWNIRSVST